VKERFLSGKNGYKLKESHKDAVTYESQQKKIRETRLVRVPCDLERKFMDILYVILEDKWEMPNGR